MIKVILIYLLIIIISFLIGLSIRLNNTKSSLDRNTTIECEGGICPVPEEYEDGSDRR